MITSKFNERPSWVYGRAIPPPFDFHILALYPRKAFRGERYRAFCFLSQINFDIAIQIPDLNGNHPVGGNDNVVRTDGRQ